MSAETQVTRLEEHYGGIYNATLTIDFPGGSVGEYTDLIQRAIGVDLIVIDDSIRDNSMPSVVLTRVNLVSAIRVITEMNRWGGRDTYSEFYAGSPLISITGGRPQDEQVTRPITLSLRPFGQPDFDITPVIESVDAAARFLEDDSLRISVHEGSGVLFAIGTRESLNLIYETVEQVHAMSEPASGGFVEELMMAIDELHMRLEELEQRNDELMMAIEEGRFEDEEEDFEDEDNDEFLR